MDRAEQIKQAQESAYGNDACRAADHFKTGAQWADNNPSDETILRIVALYKQWYTTESSGSIEEYVKQHWEDR